MTRVLPLALAGVLVFSALLAGQDATRPPTAVSTLLLQRLERRLMDVANKTDGVVGVCVIDLTYGSMLAINGDVTFPQASVIKIPILLEMYVQARHGKFRLDDKLTLQPSDAVGGSGGLQDRLKQGSVDLTIRDLITLMIRDSDNTATNRAIALAGQDNVNRTMATLGLKNTKLQRVMIDAAAGKANRENLSTPCEMASLLQMIYQRKLVDLPSDEMIATLKLVEGAMKANLPKGVEVAAKTGGLPGVHNEAGIVFLQGRPFVLAVMCTFVAGSANPIGEVTREVYSTWERLARGNLYGHQVQ